MTATAQDLFPAESWESGDTDPSAIVNDNARRLEVALLPALSFEATQPGAPVAGGLYVLSAAWGDEVTGTLAYYFDGAWTYWSPSEGQLKEIGGDSYRYESGVWTPYSAGSIARLGLQYTADLGSTADSDPGPGLMKWNHATQASATQLFFDDVDADGVSIAGLWPELGSSGFLTAQHATDQDIWQRWKLTATVDATGYVKFTVTLIAKSSANFADGDPMLVEIQSGGGGSGTWGSITGTLSSQADLVAALALVDTRGKQAVYIAAAGMRPAVATPSASLVSIASAAGQPDITSLDFDPSAQEYAQVSFVPPKKWNGGTLTFIPIWSHAATVTNFGVAWGLQGLSVADDESIAQAWGTGAVSVDTGGTTNDVYLGPESAAMTLAGTPAKNEMVFLRVFRQVANAGDTMAIDARLHGLIVFLTTDASTDA